MGDMFQKIPFLLVFLSLSNIQVFFHPSTSVRFEHEIVHHTLTCYNVFHLLLGYLEISIQKMDIFFKKNVFQIIIFAQKSVKLT